jgi:hypothetical protein
MSNYRDKALAHYPHVCSRCGADEEPLQVHHRDGNHTDDGIANLQLLCHPCHVAEHVRMRHGGEEGFTEVLFTRLSPATAAELRAVAEEEGVSVSSIARKAVAEYLERRRHAKDVEKAVALYARLREAYGDNLESVLAERLSL